MQYEEFVYQDRVVAFIDILGWSTAVAAAGPEGSHRLGWLVHLLHHFEAEAVAHRDFLAQLANNAPGYLSAMQDMEVTQFSDCVVVSLPIDAGSFGSLEQLLGRMCHISAQNGFLLRGGVVRAPIFHREGIVYGPALAEAYNLEKRARYPRIIVSEEFAVAPHGPWRRDRDGRVFFDYLKAFGVMPNTYKSVIGKGLFTATNYNILRKYAWARRYYDETLGPNYEGERGDFIGFEHGDNVYVLKRGEWLRPSQRHARSYPRPR